MEHKAFTFDFDSFEKELLPILTLGLEDDEIDPLVSFIEEHQSVLSEPYEGDPLTNDWRGLLEYKDAHQLGDFALTKYYCPYNDVGLGSEWFAIQEIMSASEDLPFSPVLGKTIGTDSNVFDPGKMGLYFQSTHQTRMSYQSLSKGRVNQLQEKIDAMFLVAIENAMGLYITF